MHTIRFWLFLLLVAQAAIGPGVVAQGQDVPSPGDTDVIGTSFIVRPYDTEVVAYASTELGYTLQDYYDGGGYVVLTSDGASQYGTLGQGGEVDGTLTASLGASDYLVTATHYVIPDVDTEDSSGTIYMNPYFSGSWGSGSCTLGDGQGGPDSCLDVEAGGFDETAYGPPDEIDIGTTSDEVNTAPPVIYSISDANGTTAGGVTVHSSGTLDIVGAALTASGSDMNPEVKVVPTSGLSWQNVVVVDDGHLQLTGYNATSVGTYNVTVTTNAGTSNQYSFVVGDPTPVLTTSSVSPQPWYAQQSPISVTITGQGFGTNPQLSVSGGGVTSAVVINSTDNGTSATITASVTIAANTPGGIATVTVASQGYSPCGGLSTCWVPVQSGQSAGSNAEQVQVIPVPTPPAPTIMFGPVAQGTMCSNGTAQPASILVGQKIAFSGCLPAGVAASSETWAMDGNYQTNAIAGWIPSSTAATQAPTAVAAPNCGTAASCDVAAFYFIAPGSYTFRFSYIRASDQRASPQTSVTLNVTGPTPSVANGPFLTATVQPAPQGANPAQIVNVWPGQPPYLGFGQHGGANPGIIFSMAAQPPPGNQGSFQFVQVITQASYDHRTNQVVTGSLGTGLDNWYPYPAGVDGEGNVLDPLRAGDGPGLLLTLFDNLGNPVDTPIGESLYAFSATMYLMWDPALPAGCAPASDVPQQGQPNPQPSKCGSSIPVPLGYVTWGFTGDTINTLNANAAATANTTGSANGTGWVLLNCSGPSALAVQQNGAYQVASYPKWTTTVHNKQ
jgi:hypothetical protein